MLSPREPNNSFLVRFFGAKKSTYEEELRELRVSGVIG